MDEEEDVMKVCEMMLMDKMLDAVRGGHNVITLSSHPAGA
jgi:hypothetical protein